MIHVVALPGYLTIGIFDRSMVMATAAISTAPKTMFWAKMLTPRKVMPMRTTEMISAPTSVRQMLPTPPVIAVPPTTTAAIEGSSSSAASVGEPLASRPARTTPASAAKAAGQDEGEDLLPVDLDAGGIGGRLARADGGAVAAEARTALQDMGDHQHDQPDDDDVRHAEHACR